jgi:hypothetical protein
MYVLIGVPRVSLVEIDGICLCLQHAVPLAASHSA